MADEPQSSEKKQEESDIEETPKNIIKVTVKTPKDKEVIEVDDQATVAKVMNNIHRYTCPYKYN